MYRRKVMSMRIMKVNGIFYYSIMVRKKKDMVKYWIQYKYSEINEFYNKWKKKVGLKKYEKIAQVSIIESNVEKKCFVSNISFKHIIQLFFKFIFSIEK